MNKLRIFALLFIVLISGCATAQKIETITVYKVIYITPEKPMVFAPGGKYVIIFEMSEQSKYCTGKIGDRIINFISDDDGITWKAEFVFPLDGSLDNEEYMIVDSEDMAGNKAVIGKVDPKYMVRDENGEFPDIEYNKVPIIIKKKK